MGNLSYFLVIRVPMVLGSYFGKPRRVLMLHILDFIYRVSSNFDHIVLRKNFTLFFFLEKKKNLMESFSFLPSIVLHPELEMDGGVIVFSLCLLSHTCAHVQAEARGRPQGSPFLIHLSWIKSLLIRATGNGQTAPGLCFVFRAPRLHVTCHTHPTCPGVLKI